MEKLSNAQKQLSEELQRLYRNFKKDANDRKTAKYIQEHWENCKHIWQLFVENDKQIQEIAEQHSDHPYFVNTFFKNTKRIFEEYTEKLSTTKRQLIEADNTIITTPTKNDLPSKTLDGQTKPTLNSETNDWNITFNEDEEGAVGHTNEENRFRLPTQQVTMKSKATVQQTKMEHLFTTIDQIKDGMQTEKTNAFYKYTIKKINDQWEKINAIHDNLIVEYKGYENHDNCNILADLEKEVDMVIIEMEEKMESTRQPENTTFVRPIRLKAMEIPKFGGNYHAWKPFHDLFNSMIHTNNTLGNAQKLQYLKAALSGEASKLISHISISDENYIDAWNMLTDRYMNQRLLVSAQLDILTTQKSYNYESAAAIKSIHDTTRECMFALNNLNIDTANWSPIIIHILTKKLDKETLRIYEQGLKDPKEVQNINEFLQFLEQRFQSLEITERPNTNHTWKVLSRSNDQEMIIPTAEKVNGKEKENVKCGACNLNTHPLFMCQAFKKMNYQQRLNYVNRKHMCTQCLQPEHGKQKCKYKSNCKYCNNQHNTLLHQDEPNKTCHNTINEATINPKQDDNPESMVRMHLLNNKTTQVLLATALCKIKANNGTSITVRALIDQGSQVSIITSKTASKLGLPINAANVRVTGLGATNAGRIQQQMEIELQSCYHEKTISKTSALIMKKLTNAHPSAQLEESSMLHNLLLADPTYKTPGPIDILIGADMYVDIIIDGLIKGAKGTPIAQNTELGWILCGPILDNTERKNITTLISRVDIDNQLRTFWEIEESHPKKIYSIEEKTCEEHFKLTHTRDETGRYIVRLPLKETEIKLGNSKWQAGKRFQCLEKKLALNPTLSGDYKKFMSEYHSLGHMIQSNPHSESCETVYYLPHHAVIKPDSISTKLRVVFDASAKSTNGRSLNDELLTGPTLQNELNSILIKWRKHAVVICADIAKMYRQILVAEEDQHLQKILWRSSINDDIQEYQLTTVTYGTACAPYLAIRTLLQLAEDEGHQYPVAAESIKTDFYVDDLMTGADTITEAMSLQHEISCILRKGGFELHKWASNSAELLQNIPEEAKAMKMTLDIKSDDTIKTLGIHWNPRNDTFGASIKLAEIKKPITKRLFLSDVAKIFDPVGWYAPVIIKAKIMFQELWLEGIDWDDALPQNLAKQWEEYRSTLHLLEDIKISRWLNYNPHNSGAELHGFSDASQSAYAAVVYLKVVDTEGQCHVTLITSKTRVAPLKPISIPRLELCAAVLLSNLMHKIKIMLKINNLQEYAWTDSTTVLGWIKGHPWRYKTFVANRVVEIQSQLNNCQWGYVSSDKNPADVASRGIDPTGLRLHSLWWCGPPWLLTGEQPVTMEPICKNTTLELKSNKQCHLMARSSENNLLIRYSDLTKLLRITSYIIRFKENCGSHQQNRKIQTLTAIEINQSLLRWIKIVQSGNFSSELESLNKTKPISKKSKIASLVPFLDKGGIMRIGGRLQNSSLPYSQQHPIILSKKCYLTTLIIRDAHIKTLHSGTQGTLTYIRNKYWIIDARNTVKHIINACTVCHRQKKDTMEQLMGSLPSTRVNISRPFTHTGIDFAGPIELKYNKGRGNKTTKGYIALFICFATRAIHLEAVSDLSTLSFIAAYRRFVGRRGLCTNIYSDNGTNFVGAARILLRETKIWKLEIDEKIINTLASLGTTWHFIPPGSPHFGGLWEAGVKSMKHHLHRIMKTKLTYEEMATVLAQIEGILNSRPICPMTHDPDDLMILTPGHFLTGTNMLSTTDPDLSASQINRLTRWQVVQHLKHTFWKHWSSEYLSRLQQRPKWRNRTQDIKVGDMVLVKHENIPSGEWPLGRITGIHPGKDGITRVVTVKCRNKTITRPITKISLLPITKEDTYASEECFLLQNQYKKNQMTQISDSLPIRKTSRTQQSTPKINMRDICDDSSQ